MNIVLTGFMGTGKTAVGKRLARRLGWRFVDVDALIEAKAKMPIAKIFVTRGETVFRRLERRTIARIVRGRHQVVATGGGAFVDPQSRSRLRACGTVICLAASPQVILSRVGRTIRLRPLLAEGTSALSRIRSLLAQRAAAYAKADATIKTDDLSVDAVVEQLWQALSPVLSRSWHYFLTHVGELSVRYGGRYVVVEGERVVGSGRSHLEAYRNACLPSRRHAPETGIYYIPLPEESLTAF